MLVGRQVERGELAMRTLLFAGEGGWADHRTPQLLHSAGWQVVVADRLAQARASLAAGGYDRLVLAVPPEGPGAAARQST